MDECECECELLNQEIFDLTMINVGLFCLMIMFYKYYLSLDDIYLCKGEY